MKRLLLLILVPLSALAFTATVQNALQVQEDGTASAPAYSWSADTDLGLYRIGANNLGVTCGGTKILDVASTGLTVTGTISATGTGTIKLPDGTAAAPSLTFTSDTDDGLYYIGANNFGITTNGTKVADFDANSFNLAQPIEANAGAVTAPGYAFSGDANMGLYRIGADNLGIALNGSKEVDLSTTAATFTHKVVLPDGAAATPGVTFTSDATDTGLYYSAANTIGIASNAASVGTIDADSWNPAVPVEAANGSAAAPSLAFVTEKDCGLYYSAANTIGIATNGASVATIDADSINLAVAQENAAGAVGTPSITWTGDTNCGWYHAGADDMRAAANGADVLQVNTSGITVTGNVAPSVGFTFPDGLEATPGYAFTNDADCGLYRIGANNLGFSLNATKEIDFAATGVTFTHKTVHADGAAATPGITFTSDPTDTGLYYSAANTIGVATNAASVGTIDADSWNFAVAQENAAGAVGTPSIAWTGDADCGIYHAGADDMGIAANGADVIRVSAATSTFTGVLSVPLGAAATPTIYPTGDANTGIYSEGADQISISAGGAMVGNFTSTGLNSCAVGATTAAAGAFTTLDASGATGLDGAVTLGDNAADVITVTGAPTVDKSSPSLHHAMDGYYKDGKSTTTVWTANSHPIAQILQAWVTLTEVPDAVGTTFTVQIDDGTNNITNLVTFTEGVDTAGTTVDFTVDANWDNIAKTEAVRITTAGTTAVAGEAVVYFTYVGE